MRRGLTLIALLTVVFIAGVLTGCSSVFGHKNNPATQAKNEGIVPLPVTMCYFEDDGSVDYMVTNIPDEQGNTIASQYRTCSVKNKECKCAAFSGGTDITYEENGHKEFFKECDKIDSTGKCITYKYGIERVFDDHKNVLNYRRCHTFDNEGKCATYTRGADLTYDSNGKLTAYRICCMDEKGKCSSYAKEAIFSYNAKGQLTSAREYDREKQGKQCVWDEEKNPFTAKLAMHVPSRACPINQDGFDESKCLLIGNYDVFYDKQQTASVKLCDKVDASGKCTAYTK